MNRTDGQVGWVVACTFCGLFGWAIGSPAIYVQQASNAKAGGCGCNKAKPAPQVALSKPLRFDSEEIDLAPEPEAELLSVGQGSPTPIKED
ncbi:hypothetical protein GC163_19980 [bacterium]|nr:hypothetical protein [bacterium]